jgi:hypothetical protein
VEESDDVDGILLILNTMGGDVEAGLALAELISSMKKPTVSLVLGGGHSIGIPLATSAQYSLIVPSATMTLHPVRINGTVLGVPQSFRYMSEMHELSMMNFPKRSEMGNGNKSEKKEWKAPTDEEVEKMIKGRFTQSRKMLDLREKYYDVFRKFLSPKQIQKVYDMETKDSQRFHQEMNRRSGMKAPQGRQRPSMP